MTHENPGGWLMETLKNKIRESNRAQKRYLRRVLSVEPPILAESAPPDDSFDRLGCKFMLEEIRKVLTAEELYLLERLEELIRAVIETPDHTNDEVIKKREREHPTGRLVDMDEAWAEFQRYYNIPEGRGCPYTRLRARRSRKPKRGRKAQSRTDGLP